MMKPPFPTGTIDRFFPMTPYFFLSNFYPSAVTYEDMTFTHVEHAYQAAKTLDMNIRQLIMRVPSPAGAKIRGKTIQLRPDWDTIKFEIMHNLLLQKFKEGSANATSLKATGSALLIEGNYWHDLVWGQCFCPMHKWNGCNRLGGFLMSLREEL